MKATRRIALATMGAALAMGLALPATAQSLQEITDKGSLAIGMLVDFPPFGITDSSNEPDGYDADVARLLAEYLGVEPEIIPVTGPNRIPYLLSGQVDVLVASLGVTPERAERVDFSDPYAAISIGVVAGTDLDIETPEDLAGHTIAVARASTQDTAVTAVAPEGATIQRFDDDASAVQALLSGQVDVIGISNVVGLQIKEMGGDRFDDKFSLSEQMQGIVVRPGSTELLDKINEFLRVVKDDGRLNEIHEKWLAAPLPDSVRDAG